ncbi:response regulator [Paenibacillus koleovorans]|uniref:response regulator n=1 Tax=Paenibacillus koleovorans TaxID=121608 RepID=UPI000FD7DAF7|nr:response regulator [Paenibacillus koleovorans]
MIRVLIVDDEILVRIGLKTIIPLQDHGFAVIGEASNGLEALAILEREACDIVLTDIRMPKMDGLELLEQIRKRWPAVKCLILSNHDDFGYVQKALRLGASEYIIKLEIDPEELMEKLNELKREVMEQRQLQSESTRLEFQMNRYGQEVKEKRLRELLLKQCGRNETQEVLEEFQISPFEGTIHVIAAGIERYDSLLENNRFKSERLLTYAVANILGELLRDHPRAELVEIGSGRFAIVCDRFHPELLVRMQESAERFLKITVSFGISAPFEDPLQLHLAYAEAEQKRAKPAPIPYRQEIRTIIRVITEQFHLPLKVSELAKEVGFTENYLSVLFRKETGETITDYITQVRMKKAKELLLSPDNKIYEVSEMAGYPDPNHFSRVFKQMEGMYPSEYRKHVLSDRTRTVN